MGKTSNAVKQKWLASHYTQVKFSTKPETVSAFKASCAAAGVSMAGTLSDFMLKYAGQPGTQNELPANVKNELPIVKTLRDRRKTAVFVRNIITALIDAEEKFIDNAPENLRESPRYEMAQERVSQLQDTLDTMDEVYIE